MSGGLLIQYVVLGLIVASSLLVVFRKLAPQLSSRWLAAASIRLSRRDARFMKSLARWLQPKQGTGDCSDGCSTCGACGAKPPVSASSPGAGNAPGPARTVTEPMPLRFRPRGR